MGVTAAQKDYALDEVTVRVDDGDQTVVGRGSSTDIIEALAKAYVNALNKLQTKRERLAEHL